MRKVSIIFLLLVVLLILPLFSNKVSAPNVKYNFTAINSNRVYGISNSVGTINPAATVAFSDSLNPTIAEAFQASTNFTNAGYLALQSDDANNANLTGANSNKDPFATFNFTINKPVSSITGIYVGVKQTVTSSGAAECCYYELANFTNADIFEWNTRICSGAATTFRSYNFTNLAEIPKLIDSNNHLTVFVHGADMDASEGCAVDWVNVSVYYNTTIIFSGATANETTGVAINKPVNFTMGITTSNDDLSGYIFSSNFSGNWQNSTFIPLTGTQTSATIWNISTAPTAGIYAWLFYANTSTNFENVSAMQYFNFSTKQLLVSWTPYNAQSQINSTSCTVNSPCSYQQYNIFNASANITCNTNPSGLSCGSITGGVMYNTSSSAYSFVNTTSDASPFYTIPSYTLTCVNLANLGDDYIDKGSPDNNYGIINSIYVGNYSGNEVRESIIKFNTTLSNTTLITSIQSARLFLFYGGGGDNGRVIDVYNTSDRYLNVNSPWGENTTTWNNVTSINTLQSQNTSSIVTYNPISWNVINGFISAFNNNLNISLLLKDDNELTAISEIAFLSKEYTTASIRPYLTVCYGTGFQNPSSLGSLSGNQYYLLNYTINATITNGNDYKLIYNFTSATMGINENDTDSAYVRIAAGVDNTAPTYSSVGTNNTAPVALDVILYYANWTDNVALSHYIFSFNGTGVLCDAGWTNDTAAAFGVGTWSNVTKQELAICVGKVVAFRFYANDTNNNWSDTGIIVPTSGGGVIVANYGITLNWLNNNNQLWLITSGFGYNLDWLQIKLWGVFVK
jgi:hypothetical protein